MTNVDEEQRSWDEGVAFVASKGYTEHFSTGACGDNGYGSRQYFRKPNAELNQFGWPLEHATLSYLEGKWHVSIFEKAPQKPACHLRIVGGTDHGD